MSNHPEIKKVVILANSESSREDEPNRYLDAIAYKNQIDEFQKDLPKENRVDYHVLDVPYENDFSKNYAYFRSLIKLLKNPKNQEYRFILQLDSGPTIWRFALYQCAHEFRENMSNLIIYDKIREEEQSIPLFYELNTVEKNLLDVLMDYDGKSISYIREEYNKTYPNKSLSYILKMVNKLTIKGFTIEEKIGRKKIVKLTPYAKEILSEEKYLRDLEKIFQD